MESVGDITYLDNSHLYCLIISWLSIPENQFWACQCCERW